MTAIPRPRTYEGPPVLSYGFRPFFLIGAIYAALAILVWLPRYFGELTLGGVFSPLAWHTHEMLFGFLPAIITGFLLTAIPNWTGRLPLQGTTLLALLSIWLLGRAAIGVSAIIGWLPAMTIDCAFLAVVAATVTREIVAGKNWRNLKVVAILVLLLAANAGFHLEAHYTGNASYAERAGVALVLLLVMLIGGRIVPSCTHNWLVKMNLARPPASNERIDRAIVGITLVALLAWVISPSLLLAGVALLLAAAAQSARLASWAGWRAWRNPLVLILHIAYGFVLLGFALSGAAVFYPDVISASAGVHAWTAGAMGGMILAVMTRASLGHTGRELRADLVTNCLYAAILVSAATCVSAALDPSHAPSLLVVSGLARITAFLGFAMSYGPVLARPRLSAQ
jgi:uncharacterized protein involved in response to NO